MENVSVGKNAFEIRLKVLQMAKELVMDEFYFTNEHVRELIRENPKKVTAEDLKVFPTEEEILNKAKKLNEFIITKQ